MAKNKRIVFESEDRDAVLKKIIEDDRLDHAESHLGEKTKHTVRKPYWSELSVDRNYTYYSEYNKLPKDSSISLVIAPAWGIIFPPYNIARLTGLLRHYNYDVYVHDVNIDTQVYVKNNHDKDYWESRYYYAWERPVYDDEVFPIIKPVLDQAIKNIINDNTNIVGFSLYLTNLLASMYMIEEIKKQKPNVKIVVGGPEAFNDWFEDLVFNKLEFKKGLIDFRITGEGEQELLSLLETYESYPDSDEIVTFGGFKSSLDINELPFPDYSDYDLNLYDHPEGASIETSRGCVAKCSFCAETWFWKYRFRKSNRVIEEMKHQVETYGTTRFWFVDSLANGAFSEFKNLVNDIIDQKLDIKWNSYARCDGRMDAEMFRNIAKSGCLSLSFGVESGSQKVLNDMKKKVEIWEVEHNLRDGHLAGMKNHVNWVVGFPTEGPAEFLHSLHVLYNTRNWMFAISPGMTCGDAPFSDLNVNWQDYDLQWKNKPWDNTFMSNWFTANYKNTIIHRFIRLKFMLMWLDMAVDVTGATVINAQHRPKLKDFYTFETNKSFEDYITQEENQSFDYFSSNDVVDNLSCSLANEYIPFAWAMWKVYGDFKFTMKSDPESDVPEFGGFIASPYWADVTIEVKNNKLDFYVKHKFKHETTREDPRVARDEVVSKDMSFDWQEYKLQCDITDFNGTINVKDI